MDVGPAAVWQLQDQALPLSRVLLVLRAAIPFDLHMVREPYAPWICKA